MARRKGEGRGEEKRREESRGTVATRGRSRDDPGCVYLYEPGERTRNLLAVRARAVCTVRRASSFYTAFPIPCARLCSSWLAGWPAGGLVGWLAGWLPTSLFISLSLFFLLLLPLSLSLSLHSKPRIRAHRTVEHTYARPVRRTRGSGGAKRTPLAARRLVRLEKWVNHQRVTGSRLAGAPLRP